MQGQYNLRNPAVKRLMREAQELSEPTEQYHAQPLEDNLFEWHFTIRGPADSEFDGGMYHGRIVLPAEYPMKPPSIILLTPNGRFEVFKKICLSISGHHPESWQPSWSIRTALLAIIGFMPTHGNGAIGSLDYSAEERKVLSRRSKDFKCETCGEIKCILKPVTAASEKTKAEAKELAKQISFQGEKEKKNSSGDTNKIDKSGASVEQGATAPAPESSTAPPGGAQAHQLPPQRFPMFPPMGFPPFPPAMFRPPTTNSGATLSPMMMPPFWPPAGVPTTQHQARMPFFPPGFMMPGAFPQPSQGNQSTQSGLTQPSTQSDTASSGVESRTAQSTGSNTPINSTEVRHQRDTSNEGETSTNAGQIESNTSENLDSIASANTSASTDSNAQASTSGSAPGSSTQPELRRRHVDTTAPTSSGQVAAAVAAAATTPRRDAVAAGLRLAATNQQRQRHVRSRGAGHNCAVVLMVVVAVALVILIIRRLIMMKIIEFDLDF